MTKPDFYDAAHHGPEPRRHEPLPREVLALELLRPHLKTARRFLDVGCGDGFFLASVHAVAPNLELFGVDRSVYQLAKAKAVLKQAILREADIEQGLPWDDEAVDLIYAGEILEHVYSPDLLLDECHRVLTAGGTFVLTTPNLCAWYNRALFAFGIQPLFTEASTRSSLVGAGPTRALRKGSVPVGHLRVFNRRALTDLLEASGFEVVTVRSAVFDAFPAALQSLDKLFTPVPGLGSIFVIAARKR